MVPEPDSERTLESTVNMLTYRVRQQSELRQPPAGPLCYLERKGIHAQQPLQRENWRQRVMLCLYMEERM